MTLSLRRICRFSVHFLLILLLFSSTSLSASIAEGYKGAVSSAESHATKAGLEVLQEGGNAIDASIAVAFALAVTHPSAGNIGGGGFLVYRAADGSTNSIDYREKAPSESTHNMYLDESGSLNKKSLIGGLAAGIPGTVAGMAMAHEKYGSLPWKRLLAPAIRLAEEGHHIDSWHAKTMRHAMEKMQKIGAYESAQHYRKADGSPYEEGDLWVQGELANTLRMIAEKGPESFYRGAFAKKLAKGVRSLGGIWTYEDLKNYNAVERIPLVIQYRGHEITTMPPPSAGGVVMGQILTICEFLNAHNYSWTTPHAVHLYVEAARWSYVDRNTKLGDPDFINNPLEKLMSRSYLQNRAQKINRYHATKSTEIADESASQKESEQTTHFSVVDSEGNAVSNTYTLNTGFGAKVVVPGTGILLNNEMDDFAAKPGEANRYGLVQGENNSIAPNKRMLSSMTPSIVTKDNKLRAVVGSPGGSTITTTVVQIIRHLIDHQLSLEEAILAPRIHHQWLPDTIYVEKEVSEDMRIGLQAMGHEITERKAIGHANCIEV
ncbi:MAG: gamma-glutamyltransferase [Waddliaceae bacterium]|nr:gamma-glutamyltransferase [Waddliaceae bacterium]